MSVDGPVIPFLSLSIHSLRQKKLLIRFKVFEGAEKEVIKI